jgi:methylated-DNA-[protein]-cysteine S-methyltransferase
MPTEALPGRASVGGVHTVDTPIGPLLLHADDGFLTRIEFGPATAFSSGAPPFPDADAQLLAYFAGELEQFELPLAPRGTAFQRSVWDALAEVPYGTTTTYSALAARIGRPSACRAVGAANGRNPLPVIVPCHRVIGAAGALTGYGGGLARKRHLLALEAAKA